MESNEYKEAKALADAQGDKVRQLKATAGTADSDIAEAVDLLKKLKLKVDAIHPTYNVPKEKKEKESNASATAKKEERKKAHVEQINKDAMVSFASMDSQNPNFAVAPMVRSQERLNREYTLLKDLTPELTGKKVLIRARVHTARGKGNAAFVVLRQQLFTAQVAIFAGEAVAKPAVQWAANIPRESFVDVEGVVQAVPTPIVTCTQQNIEIHPTSIKVISTSEILPFNIEDAARNTSAATSDADALQLTVLRDQRLDFRWIDLRTPANQGIMRIQSAVGQFFREFLIQEGFTEIHSPKIIGAASESGASVFKLGYFGDDAFLAQSPQLYKQMAICADMKRVFEIAPVFRAENSNTHRHLCEFVGLDLEMEIKEHYREILDLFGRLFVFIFDNIKNRCAAELAAINAQYPFEPLVYPKDPVIISFSEGIKLLIDSGYPDAHKLSPLVDIDTPTEKALGKLVKAKYNTDFYMMDRFPASARPFYTMQCPDDERFTNSYDFYIRGEEILSGAQRIHDATMLERRCQELGIAGIDDYINSFRHGAPPHGGGGIGLERVVMLYLGLDNIRKTSMFPRTPTRLRP